MLDVGCGGGFTIRRLLKSGGKFAILVEVVDSDSKWTSVVEVCHDYRREVLSLVVVVPDKQGYSCKS